MSLTAFLLCIWSYVDVYTVLVLLTAYWVTRYFMWHGLLLPNRNPPPSFFGLPFVGVVPYFVFGKKTALETMADISKKHGPVIRMRFGNEPTVVINGTKAVKEAMLNDDLLGRPKSAVGDEDLDPFFTKKSILTLEGDLWRKHRRFTLTALRDLGFGKTAVMEERIQGEIRALIEKIESSPQPFDIQPALVESTGNNIISLIFGGKFSSGNDKKERAYDLMIGITKGNERMVSLQFIPFALRILSALNIGAVRLMKEHVRSFLRFLSEDFDEHKSDLEKNSPRDYLDHYLIAQEKDKDFSDEIAKNNAIALFVAGTSTVRVSVEHLLYMMADKPGLQRKVQAEIDEVTGRSREVIWSDNTQLIYTMAVIAERHRYFSVTPVGLPRRVQRPTKVCGFDLNQNEAVILNMDSVNYDPETFENPYEFRPERFIDADGKLVNTDRVWAFSIGKRACPGETLAVIEVFLLFTRLLQRFNIDVDEPIKFRPQRCFYAETLPQKIRFTRRT